MRDRRRASSSLLLDGYTQTREIIKAHGYDLARTRGAFADTGRSGWGLVRRDLSACSSGGAGASLPELYESWHSTDVISSYGSTRFDVTCEPWTARSTLRLPLATPGNYISDGAGSGSISATADDLCLAVIDDITGWPRRISSPSERFYAKILAECPAVVP